MIETFDLFVSDLRIPGQVYTIKVTWWFLISEVKRLLHEEMGAPPARQHLFYSTNPTPLSNSLSLHDMRIERSCHMLSLWIDDPLRPDYSLSICQEARPDEAAKALVGEVQRGLLKGQHPTATDQFEGSGGVYFMRGVNGLYIGVFKPQDEEQGMPNNPKDHVGTGEYGLRPHFKPGQGCIRELAAYIMDVKHFANVPTTTLVHCEHPCLHYTSHPHLTRASYPKYGSLQQFVRCADLFEDIGPGVIGDYELQKIALLDLRILNNDRNSANILVNCSHDYDSNTDSDGIDSDNLQMKMKYELTPIDHGYSFPSKLAICDWDWVWYYYPQVTRPTHRDIIAYVKSLNIASLVRRLREQGISDDCIYLVQLSHLFLTLTIDSLTLKEIASCYVRGADEEPSRLELLVMEAEENAYRMIELRKSDLPAIAEKNEQRDRGYSSLSCSSTKSDDEYEYYSHDKIATRYEGQPLSRIVKSLDVHNVSVYSTHQSPFCQEKHPDKNVSPYLAEARMHIRAPSPVSTPLFPSPAASLSASDNGIYELMDARDKMEEEEKKCDADKLVMVDDMPAATGLSRVISFSAFESPLLYDSLPRSVGNLRSDRRKFIALSDDFKVLRWNFTQEAITSLAHRLKRSKGSF